MSYARSERRREAREGRRGRRAQSPGAWTPPDAEPRHGGVVGRLDDGRFWTVFFAEHDKAVQFLTILGPPPATEERLNAALKAVGKGRVRYAD
jgi:hypothetical protein